MIAIDTSAIMAIVLDEPQAEECMAALEENEHVVISSGTLAETLIASGRWNVSEEVTSQSDGLGFEIVTVTEASARRTAEVYAQWGKGVHPAGLNFGDRFAYEGREIASLCIALRRR